MTIWVLLLPILLTAEFRGDQKSSSAPFYIMGYEANKPAIEKSNDNANQVFEFLNPEQQMAFRQEAMSSNSKKPPQSPKQAAQVTVTEKPSPTWTAQQIRNIYVFKFVQFYF